MNVLFFVSTVAILSCGIHEEENNGQLSLNKTTAMKGITAFLIMLYHCSVGMKLDVSMPILNIGWYGVALFFFFSGYGLCRSDGVPLKPYNRIIKILLPYLMAYCVYLPIKATIGINYGGGEIAKSLLGKSSVVDNGWFPIASILFYLIHYYSSKQDYRNIALVILTTGITVVEIIVYKQQSYWYISNLAFAVGALISRKDHRFQFKKAYFVTAICVYAMAVLITRMPFSNNGIYLYVLISNLKSSVVALLAVMFALFLPGYNRWARFLGKISYEMNLYHGLFILIWQKIFDTYAVQGVFLFVPICTVIFAWIINKADQLLIHLLFSGWDKTARVK